MKKIIIALFCIFVPIHAQAIILNEQANIIEVCYSPAGKCSQSIIRELKQAKTEVHILAYSFTSKVITQTIKDLAASGVKIYLIIDKQKSIERYTTINQLKGLPNIEILVDPKHAIAHNKVMLIDNNTIITGSYNFTQSAETRNGENIIILQSEDVMEQYKSDWNLHKSHSTAY